MSFSEKRLANAEKRAILCSCKPSRERQKGLKKMKKIAEIENAYKADKIKELNISYTFYRAYCEAKERKNQHINFRNWNDEVDAIMADLKRHGIKTFTISNESTGLMGALADFCARGCKIIGMVKINGRESMNDKFEIFIEQENAIELKMPR